MVDPEAFVLPSDPSAIMAIADYLNLDDLVRAGADQVQRHIRAASGMTDELCGIIAAMSDPLRQCLLDMADPDIFDILRHLVRPYCEQYRLVVRRMLHDNRFSRCLPREKAEKVFSSLMSTRQSLYHGTRHGAMEMESLARVDKTLFSPDYCGMATLNRGAQRLSVWSLPQPCPRLQDMYHGVVDFAFSPSMALVVLRWDGGVSLYRESTEIHSLKCGGNNDGLTVADHCALTFSSLHAWLRDQLDPIASTRLWNWTSSNSFDQGPLLSTPTGACLSSDGSFVAYYQDDGDVHLCYLGNGDGSQGPRTHTLRHTDRTELGDVLSLILSEDDSLLIATYARAIETWRVDQRHRSAMYDLGAVHGETVGHAVASADGRLIALGSWEGHITLLACSDGGLVELGRMAVGGSVLHIDWSPDRLFFAVSSYAGVRLVRSRFMCP